jgi:hypothetical protein
VQGKLHDKEDRESFPQNSNFYQRNGL